MFVLISWYDKIRVSSLKLKNNGKYKTGKTIREFAIGNDNLIKGSTIIDD